MIELKRIHGAKIGSQLFQRERAVIISPLHLLLLPPLSLYPSSLFTPQPVPHPSISSPFLPTVTQSVSFVSNVSLPNSQELIVNRSNALSMQRSLISCPIHHAERAISRSDSLLCRPVVSRGGGEHESERRSRLRIDRLRKERS